MVNLKSIQSHHGIIPLLLLITTTEAIDTTNSTTTATTTTSKVDRGFDMYIYTNNKTYNNR
jgi:hypothetical protein